MTPIGDILGTFHAYSPPPPLKLYLIGHCLLRNWFLFSSKNKLDLRAWIDPRQGHVPQNCSLAGPESLGHPHRGACFPDYGQGRPERGELRAGKLPGALSRHPVLSSVRAPIQHPPRAPLPPCASSGLPGLLLCRLPRITHPHFLLPSSSSPSTCSWRKMGGLTWIVLEALLPLMS